jgi:hypothetical protein
MSMGMEVFAACWPEIDAEHGAEPAASVKRGDDTLLRAGLHWFVRAMTRRRGLPQPRGGGTLPAKYGE